MGGKGRWSRGLRDGRREGCGVSLEPTGCELAFVPSSVRAQLSESELDRRLTSSSSLLSHGARDESSPRIDDPVVEPVSVGSDLWRGRDGRQHARLGGVGKADVVLDTADERARVILAEGDGANLVAKGRRGRDVN